MEKIKCTIERITFQNPENGYSVLQTAIKGYREEQTVVGIFHEVTVGAVLTVEGNWRVDKRYGRQFAAEKWTEELPADIIGIENLCCFLSFEHIVLACGEQGIDVRLFRI